MIKLNLENSSIDEKVIAEYSEEVAKIHEDLHSKANDEKEFFVSDIFEIARVNR